MALTISIECLIVGARNLSPFPDWFRFLRYFVCLISFTVWFDIFISSISSEFDELFEWHLIPSFKDADPFRALPGSLHSVPCTRPLRFPHFTLFRFDLPEPNEDQRSIIVHYSHSYKYIRLIHTLSLFILL